jgi:hypothetical protein
MKLIKSKNHERQQKEENKDFVPILPRITFLLSGEYEGTPSSDKKLCEH